MSFQVSVTIRDGQATVGTSGEVPEGDLIISGHEDDSARSLSVTRRDLQGRYVQVANSTHHKGV